ncbi:MAG: hypothetical protein A2252_00600 [Elusimicrobia bacterium RIFOXYA2_FULL_39_19]|nr:MAG: hypothetical protein A2252_00600 [Elusimicrobia bacterium RIFOXYA2_FULL_39_19]
MKSKYNQYIDKFLKKNILIVGDLILDKFLYGSVTRISPEAPVPVVDIIKETFMPGGAGNVANNISTLGGNAHLVGIIGADSSAESLSSKLKELNINIDGVFTDIERPTTIKTRVMASHQQIVRFDKESREKISVAALTKALNYIERVMPEMDAVMISDYGKGVITSALLSKTIDLARAKSLPITVDPKIEHFLNYKKVTCITPNLNEAMQGMRLPKRISTEKEITDLGNKILKALNSTSVIITLGEKGMAIFEKSKQPVFIPTRAKEVFDVTGAGDTVISVLTLCLSAGAPLKESAEIANYAAGLVVAKLGTATVTVDELKKSISRTI